MTDEFEQAIQQLTRPLNNQYPRPWMTKLTNPQEAEIFIVGKNQRNGYDCATLGSHQRHLDALFNRNGQSCRQMYNEMTAGKASRTRKNTDRFAQMLESVGITKILETNVICYSTPMSADLRHMEHTGGSKRGEELFRFLLSEIKPKALVVHGTGSARKLASILDYDLGSEPASPDDLRLHQFGELLIAVIPSLAPPAYNKWARWSNEHLSRLTSELAKNMVDK